MAIGPHLLWRCGSTMVILAGAPETPGLQRSLAASLLARLPSAPQDFLLARDTLGKPSALSTAGESLPFGLSFSHYAGWLWAAVTEATDVGIDASGPEEFSPPYPDQRAFTANELDVASQFVASPPEARALLWSVKEAAAKALGTGFHKVEPIGLRVNGLRPVCSGNLVCHVDSPLGGLDALTGTPCGFRIAIAARVD